MLDNLTLLGCGHLMGTSWYWGFNNQSTFSCSRQSSFECVGTVRGSLGPYNYTHPDCCGLRCAVLFIGRLFIDGEVIMM